MATEYQTKKVTELTEDTAGHSTDLLLVGDNGGAILKKMTFATLGNWIKDRLAVLTYNFNTGVSDLVTAINNLSQPTGTITYTCNCAGYVTSSSTTIGTTIPTNRVIRNVTVGSVTVNGCQIRQNGSYLYNNTSNPTDLDVSVTLNNCGLGLTIKKSDSSAFPNAVNNGVVAIYISISVTWG